jgi:GNAT superfamily N-acetyltransferase
MRFLTAGYCVRRAGPGDLPALPELERLAAVRFAEYGLAEVMSRIVTPIGMLRDRQAAGQVWVAADQNDSPVGFAVATVLDGAVHLDELDVLPEHGRKGIGTALVKAVCIWAARAGCPSITLSTLRHVPWNAPFYAKLGFEILAGEEFTPALRDLLAYEARVGLPMEDRVLMRRAL